MGTDSSGLSERAATVTFCDEGGELCNCQELGVGNVQWRNSRFFKPTLLASDQSGK